MSNLRLTTKVIRIHLASWRYLAVLTLPPLAIIYAFGGGWLSAVMSVLFLITHYYCWRLWLDERLFALLADEHSLAEFDDVMTALWPTFHGNRTLPERWRGCLKIAKRAVLSLILLWACGVWLLLTHD